MMIDQCEPSESVSNPDTEPPVGIEGEGSTEIHAGIEWTMMVIGG